VARPRLAVLKLASCSGCQLELLNAEATLLDLVSAVDLASFPMARSRLEEGPFDVVLVEGAVVSHREEAALEQARRVAGLLVAVGACATWGGLVTWRRLAGETAFAAAYPHPELVPAGAIRAVGDVVPVDLAVGGCPADRRELLEAVGCLLVGRAPELRSGPICVECRSREVACRLVSYGEPCLGPITRAGCDALCPSLGRPCNGCRGPADDPNGPGLAEAFRRARIDAEPDSLGPWAVELMKSQSRRSCVGGDGP